MWIITSLSLTLCFTGGYLSKEAPSSTSIQSKRTSWEVSTTNITARKESAAISWNCRLLTPSGFPKACDLYRVGAKLAREYLIQFNGENLCTRSVGRTTLLVTQQQIENIRMLLGENVLSFSVGFALFSFVVWVGNSPFGPEVYGKLVFSWILPFGILMFLWVACVERERESMQRVLQFRLKYSMHFGVRCWQNLVKWPACCRMQVLSVFLCAITILPRE